jgi:hypothetical protein
MSKPIINQFSPGFGTLPSVFLGRLGILSKLEDVVCGNTNSLFRSTLISGVRGVGKTTLLRESEKRLTNLGAIVVTQTSSDMLGIRLIRSLAQHVDATVLSQMTFSINLGVVSGQVALSDTENQQPDIYFDGRKLLETLDAKNRWVVFQVDEAHGHTEALQEFAKAYQQWLGEKFKVMMVMAGLPDELLALLNSDSVSFLRRAKRVELALIQDLNAVAKMYQTEFEVTEKQVSKEIAQQFANKSEGYPFLIQLLGYYAWDMTEVKQSFDSGLINRVYEAAKHAMYSSVFDLLFQSKSKNDIAYLIAVNEAMVDGSARAKQVADKFGHDIAYTSRYRQRALESGLIKEVGYGRVAFTIPMEANYVTDMAHGETLTNFTVMD